MPPPRPVGHAAWGPTDSLSESCLEKLHGSICHFMCGGNGTVHLSSLPTISDFSQSTAPLFTRAPHFDPSELFLKMRVAMCVTPCSFLHSEPLI